MKIELFVDKNHPQVNANIKYVHLTHLQTIDNASCFKIEANDCLDFSLGRDEFLGVIVSKLRYNGILNINGIDLQDVIFHGSTGMLDISQLQKLLYQGKLSADSFEQMRDKLQKLGLTIISYTINQNQYFITAKRLLPPGT